MNSQGGILNRVAGANGLDMVMTLVFHSRKGLIAIAP